MGAIGRSVGLLTPKNTKGGSGMSFLKEFLLSLLAITISIALTFGVAAIIDYNKKQAEKREIVMMVMYDMYNTLQDVADADSMIHQAIDMQFQFAEDTTTFQQNRFALTLLAPTLNYTETVEHIFSSNIETINTVGNVLFAENVSQFYWTRKQYQSMVCDSLRSELIDYGVSNSLENTLSFYYMPYAVLSSEYLLDMQLLFEQCKQMMDVTDEQLDAYRKKRDSLKEDKSMREARDSIFNEAMETQRKLTEAIQKLNLE
jgi:hypothetical protein